MVLKAFEVLIEEIAARLDRSTMITHVTPDDRDTISKLKLDPSGSIPSGFLNSPSVIDFSAETLPDFVSELSGFSWRESFGRWTDGDVARLTFKHALPPSLCLSMVMRPSGSNIDQPIVVVFGGDAQVIVPRTLGFQTYEFTFEGKGPGRLIEVFIPNAISPEYLTNGESTDKRRLGIGVRNITLAKAALLATLPQRSFFSRVAGLLGSLLPK
jgi:hypothetical protein